jgi:hypothetical protein
MMKAPLPTIFKQSYQNEHGKSTFLDALRRYI